MVSFLLAPVLVVVLVAAVRVFVSELSAHIDTME